MRRHGGRFNVTTPCSSAFNVRALGFTRASCNQTDFRQVQSEYIGALGSVDAAVSVRERLAFWAKLPERLTRLGNRIGADEHERIYAALHARIPMVTPDEQRAVQEENAKDDERFWELMRDLNAADAEGHKLLIASAEAKTQGARAPRRRGRRKARCCA